MRAVTELEKELFEHSKRVREHMQVQSDLKTVIACKKKKHFRPVIALIAAALVAAGTAAAAAALKTWNIHLIRFFDADQESMDHTEKSYDVPLISETVNGTTVTVLQFVFDENAQYILYEVSIPDNVSPDKNYSFIDFGIDIPLAEQTDSIGTIKNEIVEICGDSIIFLLQQTMTAEPVEDTTVGLYLSDFGYFDNSAMEFVTVIDGDWSIKWDSDCESAGITYIPDETIEICDGCTLEKVIISPFSVMVKASGADILGSISIEVQLKDGSMLLCEPGDDNASYIRSGNVDFVYYRVDKLLDINDVDKVLVNGIEVNI